MKRNTQTSFGSISTLCLRPILSGSFVPAWSCVISQPKSTITGSRYSRKSVRIHHTSLAVVKGYLHQSPSFLRRPTQNKAIPTRTKQILGTFLAPSTTAYKLSTPKTTVKHPVTTDGQAKEKNYHQAFDFASRVSAKFKDALP